jgi:hypothetical protein
MSRVSLRPSNSPGFRKVLSCARVLSPLRECLRANYFFSCDLRRASAKTKTALPPAALRVCAWAAPRARLDNLPRAGPAEIPCGQPSSENALKPLAHRATCRRPLRRSCFADPRRFARHAADPPLLRAALSRLRAPSPFPSLAPPQRFSLKPHKRKANPNPDAGAYTNSKISQSQARRSSVNLKVYCGLLMQIPL